MDHPGLGALGITTSGHAVPSATEARPIPWADESSNKDSR